MFNWSNPSPHEFLRYLRKACLKKSVWISYQCGLKSSCSYYNGKAICNYFGCFAAHLLKLSWLGITFISKNLTFDLKQVIQRWSRAIWFLFAYFSAVLTQLFLLRIHPQYFSSTGKILIQLQSDLYVAFQDERAKDVPLRGILQLTEYWTSPPEGNSYVKRSCCSALKWAFCFHKKKKFRVVQKNMGHFSSLSALLQWKISS